MEYLYEAVEHRDNLPIKIFTQTVDDFPFHWHDDTEILFVLKGKIDITIDNDTTTLDEGRLFIINSGEFHFIHSVVPKSQLLLLQFDMEYFRKYDLHPDDLLFNITYTKDEGVKRKAYNSLRFLLASIMKTVINREEPQSLIIEKYLLDLIITLINNFKANPSTLTLGSREERLTEIVKYVSEHYMEQNLSIEQIADNFHLNYQYISRYVKEKLGTSLKKFIDNTRLNRSLIALKTTNDRVVDIALRNGFPDAKAYYRVFKDVMGETPASYREKHKISREAELPKDYFSVNSKDTLAKLFSYLTVNSAVITEEKVVDINLVIDINTEKHTITSTFLNLCTVGYARHLLRADLLESIREAQREIGFRYIRFHGIFTDELNLYNEKDNGDVFYNFQHIDALLDSILELNLKPFIELGFMPYGLASADITIFSWKANISPPKSMEKWCNLLLNFFRHIINRYGVEEVLTWYFEFWNEPEYNKLFWAGTSMEFFNLFYESYKVIKNIHPKIKLGGFGTLYMDASRKWLEEFGTYIREREIKLDFFTIHNYQVFVDDGKDDWLRNTNILDSLHEYIDFGKLGAKLGGPDIIKSSINEIKTIVLDNQISHNEFHITEWNANTDSRDLVHDTCYMASFIVKNVIDSFDLVHSMGFWTMSDIFEELTLPKSLFHGGFGLITYNGVKKPGYYAFKFLSKLGDNLISRGENYIITSRGGNYQIIIHNYTHYNQLYSKFDYSQITPQNRYSVFNNPTSLTLRVQLKGLSGKFRLEKEWVNRDNGSAFDTWIKMGAPENLNSDTLKTLQGLSLPGYFTSEIISGYSYELETTLQPHEIQLFRLTRIY